MIVRLGILVFLASITTDCWAELIAGKVIGIADGDTLLLLDRTNKQHKIRLQGIDAPEKSQAFGRRSMQNMARLAFHKDAIADCGMRDRYGREICKVLVAGADVNLAQVESGFAWWYRAYSMKQPAPDRLAYEVAEDSARTARRGLWSEPHPVAPWIWRRRSR